MKLYAATNGWAGCGPVEVLAVAHDRASALSLASERFEASAHESVQGVRAEKPRYGREYWTRLDAKVLCHDLTKPWSSEVSDQGFS